MVGYFGFDGQSPRSIVWVGGCLGLVLLGEILVLVATWSPPPSIFWSGLVTSGPAIGGLVYGGHWVATSDLSSDRYDRIRLWCFGSLTVFLVINVVFMASVPPETALLAVGWARWAAAVGGAVGLLIGIFEARAVERARSVERLQVERKATERQNELLEEFASVVSHDLRNPLNVAQGRLQLVREEVDSDHLDHLDRSLERMETIIEETLQLAREGQTVSETEPVVLGPLLDDCWGSIDRRDAELIVADVPTIEADPARLRHVFENLFENAVKHGGDDVRVRVGPLDDEDGLFVEDDGPGIDPDEIENVFETGYTTTGQSSGFGLSIVKRIVRAHDWEIRATTSDGGGARFEITGVDVVDPRSDRRSADGDAPMRSRT